jgi:hypothetical protein
MIGWLGYNKFSRPKLITPCVNRSGVLAQVKDIIMFIDKSINGRTRCEHIYVKYYTNIESRKSQETHCS